MEVAHADFTEVTWMVLVDVGAVVVLATGHTTTTGMLAVLADTTLTGRDVAAAVRVLLVIFHLSKGLSAIVCARSVVRRGSRFRADSLLAGLAQSGRHLD